MNLHFDKFLLPVRLPASGIVTLYAIFAALWVVASGFLLMFFAIEDTVLRTRIELANGLIFVTVTSALLYLLLRTRSAASTPDAGSQPPRTRRLLLIFAALALVVPLIGFAIAKLYGPQVEREAYANLEVIARLKAEQIENWLGERYGDSEVLAGDDAFVARVARFVQHEQDAELSRLIQDRFGKLLANYHYSKILLFDASGRLLLSSGEDVTPEPVLPGLLHQTLASKRVQQRDIYLDAEGDIHLEWAIPMLVADARGERAVAVVVLRVTAQSFIFPLIQTWPTASTSGETMLVRREGESILYLNELRRRKDTAMKLTLPLADGDLPVAVAIRSAKPGTVQGKDYRDIPVLAAYRPVGKTNWHIVAKIDRDEVLAPLRDLVLLVSLIAMAAIAVVSVALLLLWRQQQRAYRLEMQARSMAAIEESEARYRGVFEYADDIIYLLNPDGTFRSLNPAFGRITGWAVEEWLGKPFAPIVHPDDSHYANDIFRKTLAGEAARSFGLRLARKSGEYFDADLSITPLGHDAVTGVLGIVRDVTERRLMEEKIQKLNVELEIKVQERTRQLLDAQEELVRKEKLSVLGQIAGSVGHELRNPLGVMNNAVYFLQTVLSDADETVREYLNIIKDEIASSERIVSDLLDSVRTKPPQPEAVSLAELIGQTLRKCTVPPSVTVKLDIPEALSPLRVDAQQIHQVFRNLISNGVEAMPEGGVLEIRAVENKQDGTITVGVCDSGSGIAPAVLSKLFQPLFTTKARGIGLGLVVVKNLTQANGGTVQVESEAGKGTVFTITLPAADDTGVLI